MSRGWDRPYPVMVVAGTDDFYRDRELSRARRASSVTGRRFTRLAEGDGDGLRMLLSATAIIADATLLVLESGLPRRRGQTANWTNEDAALVVAHHAGDDASDIAMVVAHAGDVPPNGFVRIVADAVGKKRMIAKTAPKPWAMKEEASKFLRTEVSRLGFRIGEDEAELSVKLAGTDRWLLAQEAVKFTAVLKAEGRDDVTRADVMALAAPFASEYREVLVDAVAAGNTVGVIRALAVARGSGDGDSPVAACGHLARTVAKWAHVAAILHADPKVSDEDLAKRVDVKSFVLRNSLITPAKRWGVRNLTSLLRAIVDAERGAKQGRLNPWVQLEAALVRHCNSINSPPR